MSVTVQLVGLDDPYGALSLNVANSNFRGLAEMLGIEVGSPADGLAGEFADLDDLHQRLVFCLQALRAMPDLDGGRPPQELPNPGGCRIIDCGHAEGYYTDRLIRLLGLVAIAKALNLKLVYG